MMSQELRSNKRQTNEYSMYIQSMKAFQKYRRFNFSNQIHGYSNKDISPLQQV